MPPSLRPYCSLVQSLGSVRVGNWPGQARLTAVTFPGSCVQSSRVQMGPTPEGLDGTQNAADMSASYGSPPMLADFALLRARFPCLWNLDLSCRQPGPWPQLQYADVQTAQSHWGSGKKIRVAIGNWIETLKASHTFIELRGILGSCLLCLLQSWSSPLHNPATWEGHSGRWTLNT